MGAKSTEPKVKSSTVLVTPELAEKWLEGNTHNRPVKDSMVNLYATDMKRKKWLLNGEAIVFDYTGRLMDGQHRLYACMFSKTPFESIVVTGVDPETFSTIDTGAKRTNADVLTLSGVTKYPTIVAATAVQILEYRRGATKKHGRTGITRQDVLEFVNCNPTMQDWVNKARSHKGWVGSYASHIAAVLFLAAKRYPQKAEEFMSGWLTGENLPGASPVLALRERLGTEKRMVKAERFALVVHAWNAFVEGRSLKILKLPKGEQQTILGTEVKK